MVNSKIIFGWDNGLYVGSTWSNNLNGCVRRTDKDYFACNVRVLLDVSSVEVFIDGGREVISNRIYLDGEYSLSTEGGVAVKRIMEIGKKL